MNISIIRYILGWVLAIEGGFMSLPCLVAVIYGESGGWYFAVIGTIAALTGLCMIRKKTSEQYLLYPGGKHCYCTELDSAQCGRSPALLAQWRDPLLHRRAV